MNGTVLHHHCIPQSRPSLSRRAGQYAAFRPRRSAQPSRTSFRCRAQKADGFESLRTKFAAAGAAALLTLGSVSDVIASEFDLLTEARPTTNYVLDDADVLSKTTRKGINDRLRKLEEETGYRLEVATIRRLEFENDAFAFGDKLIERWYPTEAEGTTKGILLVVTTAKDGALTGGPKFMKAVGDDLVDSIVGDNIPIFTEQEKYNETVTSSLARIEAVLSGKEDPGGPARLDTSRKRNYKTKEETDRTRLVTTTIVVTLLLIAFVVPMLQFYGYTSKD